MAVAGILRVKDEADVIAGTLRHLADEVDFLLVADNASTDGTREILAELEDTLPLTVVDDPDPAYYQSLQMSALAARAGDMGAEWIVPADADELWFGEHAIRKLCADAHGNILTAALYNHFPTAIDPAGVDPFRTIIWRQPNPAPLPKVAFRYEPGAIIHQGNHGVTLPHGEWPEALLEIRHFPNRTPEQFVRKARNGAKAYASTDLPFHVGQHWREWGALLDSIGEERFVDEVFRGYYWFLAPVESGLLHDPAPYCRWQASPS